MMDYLPEVRALLAEERLNVLGPGTPNVAVRIQLQQLASILPARAMQRDFASACLAALWLFHDFLDESHSISQELGTIEGSYWHAIMHRREPDYWNSKYWFRRFARHPIFVDLRDQAARLTEQAGTPTGCEFLVRQQTWDPAAFVDLCELAAHGSDALVRLGRQIQRAEWLLLFQYCYDRAEFASEARSK